MTAPNRGEPATYLLGEATLELLVNREFLRRLAIALGMILSIMMYTNSVGRVYLVQKPDFEKMRLADIKKEARMASVVKNTLKRRSQSISPDLLKELSKTPPSQQTFSQLTLEQYIAKRTQGKAETISGPQWQTAMRGLKEHYQGRTPAIWRDNTLTGHGRDKGLYFAFGEKPFASVAPGVRQERFLVYGQNGARNYLRMVTLNAGDAKNARNGLVHPWRTYFWVPFALGLLLYLFGIPKVKRPAEAMGYANLGGVMVSDFFSMLLAGAFFLAGFLAISGHHAGVAQLFSLSTGPMILVFSLWLLGLFSLWGMWFGISYRSFWIKLLPKGVERHTYAGARLYPYADIRQARLDIKDHGWVVRLILLLGGTNAGTAAMGLTLQGKADPGMVIDMKDGRSWRIRLAQFDKGIALTRALQEHGVELEHDLTHLLENGSE